MNHKDSTVRRRPWLQRTDQATIAALTLFGAASLLGLMVVQYARGTRYIEIDRGSPLTAQFEVDVNQADWPELAQLPEIGETLARRIVDIRQAGGPYLDFEDIRQRVPGIGPLTLDRMRPYLRPIPAAADVAGVDTTETVN